MWNNLIYYNTITMHFILQYNNNAYMMSIIVIKVWFYTMWYGRDTCTENIYK